MLINVNRWLQECVLTGESPSPQEMCVGAVRPPWMAEVQVLQEHSPA
jgi:hypothetical protein